MLCRAAVPQALVFSHLHARVSSQLLLMLGPIQIHRLIGGASMLNPTEATLLLWPTSRVSPSLEGALQGKG